MLEQLKEKLTEQTEGMEYADILALLNLDLEQIIEDKIESLNETEILKII